MIDRVTLKVHKTLGNKLILYLKPKQLTYINLGVFLAKQDSQDSMHIFSGLIAPRNQL